MANAIEERNTIEESPIIGVLCIDYAVKLKSINEHVTSYIAASYVKYLRGAGARVMSIRIGRDIDYYKMIMQQISGVLIPGGAVFVVNKSNLPNDCVRSSKIIYDLAKKKNENGDFFPIWGTCLGFQLMLLHSANRPDDWRVSCEYMNCSLSVKFEKDFRHSRLFKELNDDLKSLMEHTDFCNHHHQYCITKELLQANSLDSEWKILATNEDKNHLEFITIVEHKRYPFYGCQFHPERVEYEILEDTTHDTCLHDENAIKAAQYFARFFVDCCRTATHSFTSENNAENDLIENCQACATEKYGLQWRECYLFEANKKL